MSYSNIGETYINNKTGHEFTLLRIEAPDNIISDADICYILRDDITHDKHEIDLEIFKKNFTLT